MAFHIADLIRAKSVVDGTALEPVSYTHLDVYKRQALGYSTLFDTIVVTI